MRHRDLPGLAAKVGTASRLHEMLRGKMEWPAGVPSKYGHNINQFLFCEQERVAHIQAQIRKRIAIGPRHAKRQRTNAPPNPTHGTLYEIDWESTVITKGALELYAAHGYIPTAVRPYDPPGDTANPSGRIEVDWARTEEEAT